MLHKQVVFGTCLFVALGLSAGGLLFYKYSNIRPLRFETKKKAQKDDGIDRMKVTLTVGGGGMAAISVAIPYSHQEQVYELWKNYPRIKNDFLFQVQPEEMKRWIERRDFKAIKGRILAVVNTHLTKPVRKVYLEGFYCE